MFWLWLWLALTAGVMKDEAREIAANFAGLPEIG
jgi:hypothetical protein